MSARPRILMITTQLGYGGAETSFIRLANLLAQSMDVTVALFTNNGTYDAGHEALHAPTVLLDAHNSHVLIRRWLRRISMLRNLKRHHDVTISFLSGPNLVNVLAGNNRKSVISLRGSRFYDPVAPHFQKLFFQYVLDPVIFYLAARIVPVSDGLKHEVRRVTGAKILQKVRVISPFIHAETMAKSLTETIPAPYNTLKEQKVILGVGRLSVEKGFHHLIRVFAHVTKTHKGTKLLLVGNGPMEAELRRQCSQYGLVTDILTPETSAVIFAGYQKNVLPFMKLGTLYAMTSATEGFPNVVLEAMRAGLPIIAADTPWGTRSILCANPTPNPEPYPTKQPTTADFGMLMPRIDLPQHEHAWAEILSAALEAPPTAYPERVNDFDLAVIGENWKKLIHELS